LMHFRHKKHFEKQPQPHSQANDARFFQTIIFDQLY
jgi:hypothetical protein